jgi:ferredoxin
MHKLTLRHSGETIEMDGETSILQALRDQNTYIKSSCGGNGSCSDCIIKIALGEDNVTEPTFDEMQLLGNVFHITKERLSCQTKLTGDVSIDISAHDKASDEEKLKQKTTNFQKSKPASPARVRKKEEVDEMIKERVDKSSAKRAEQEEGWQKHWEKEQDPMKPKRLGGGKRPKLFRTDNIDYEESEPKKEKKDFRKGSKNNPNGGFPKAPSKDSKPKREFGTSAKKSNSGDKDFRKNRK